MRAHKREFYRSARLEMHCRRCLVPATFEQILEKFQIFQQKKNKCFKFSYHLFKIKILKKVLYLMRCTTTIVIRGNK